MTTGSGSVSQLGGDAESFSAAWEDVRADEAIQFEALPDYVPPEPEDSWYDPILEAIGEFFGAIARFLGTNSTVVTWMVVGLLAALVLYMLWRFLAPMLADRTGRTKYVAEKREWVPVRQEAEALLEDADRLALDGRYDEATHLLLRRSVKQIADARPGSVEPSSTAREIAAMPALSSGARAAFGTIAERVERSLFALRSLTSDDWQAARDAYAEFALSSPVEAR